MGGAGRQVEDQARIEWRKSTLSTTNGCVEVAFIGDRIALRDSKQQGRGPVLEFTAVEWDAFLGGVRGGEFDLESGAQGLSSAADASGESAAGSSSSNTRR